MIGIVPIMRVQADFVKMLERTFVTALSIAKTSDRPPTASLAAANFTCPRLPIRPEAGEERT